MHRGKFFYFMLGLIILVIFFILNCGVAFLLEGLVWLVYPYALTFGKVLIGGIIISAVQAFVLWKFLNNDEQSLNNH